MYVLSHIAHISFPLNYESWQRFMSLISPIPSPGSSYYSKCQFRINNVFKVNFKNSEELREKRREINDLSTG